MENEKESSETTLKAGITPEFKSMEFSADLQGNPGFLRSKTSLRMVYEAQSEVIRRQIGDLESVREKLGLNARKICQLLLVDPSAWNRWTQPGNSAPPHIWRALQWYMIVQEKLPGLTPQFFIERRVVTRVDTSSESKTQAWAESLGVQTQRLDDDMGQLRLQASRLMTQIDEQNSLLQTQTQQIQRLKFMLVVGLCLCFGIVMGLLGYQFKKSARAGVVHEQTYNPGQ